MPEIMNRNINLHFIGVGGIGMSGIAEILISLGYNVSGSDLTGSTNTDRLENLGAKIFIGHSANNVKGSTLVIFSSAITEDNPEMQFARSEGIPLMRRAEMIAELMKLKHGIAIAGTHGKTTTTSMLATILNAGGIDPTYIIGGIVTNLEKHASVGNGKYIVVEADESDGTYLLFNPIYSLITNVDYDHLDFYKTKENLLKSFNDFANKVPFYGAVSLNMHDPFLRKIKKELKKPYTTFGIYDDLVTQIEEKELPDYQARKIQFGKDETSYDLYYKNKFETEMKIIIPGKHNILNSLGAISLAHILGLNFETIKKGIAEYMGTSRRCQTLYEKEQFEIIDDYAHHPTEIQNILSAVKLSRPDKLLIVVFEPHRYSRTKSCWKDFFHCFNNADHVYFLPIYPASERPISGINSEALTKDINHLHPSLVKLLKDATEIKGIIGETINSNSVLVTLGAGAIGRNIRDIVLDLGN